MDKICGSQVIKIQTQMYIITAKVNFGTFVLLLYNSYSYLEKKGGLEVHCLTLF